MGKRLLVVFLALFIPASAFALEIGSPTAGLNLGLAAPVGSLGDSLKSGFDIGIFGQVDLQLIKVVLNADYSSLTSKVDPNATNPDTLSFIPVTLSALYTPPLSLGIVSPYAKLGGGLVFETLKRGDASVNNSDPIFVFGVGADVKLDSLPKELTLRAEFTYNFIYQKHIDTATDNGSQVKFLVGAGWTF